MSFGAGNIQYNGLKTSGPPFVPGSAINGVSLNAAGQIVLGNDNNDPTDPAQLLSTRQIETNGNEIELKNASDPNLDRVQIRANEIRVGVTGFATSGAHIRNNVVLISNGIQQVVDMNFTQGFTGDRAGIRIVDRTKPPIILMADLTSQVAMQVNAFEWSLADTAANPYFGYQVAGAGTGLFTQPVTGGAGKWKLGKAIAGAVALDAANYVQVNIDGVDIKLAIVV